MKQYFYIDSNKQQIGPLAEDALMVQMRCGAIYRQTLIWTEGLTDWMPFSKKTGEFGLTPLALAAENGHTEIVKLLRAAGAREKHHHLTI